MSEPVIYPVSIPTSSQLKSYNFYIVQDKSDLFLVDAGIDTEKCWEQFNLVLKESNLSLDDFDFIVLTHHHSDHIGLVNRMLAQVTLPIYAHPLAFIRLKRDRLFLKKRTVFFEHLYSEMGDQRLGAIRVNEMKRAIDDNKSQAIKGEILPIKDGDKLGSFDVLEVPGHSIDHIALYHAASGQLLVGDHLIAHISSNALIDITSDGQLFPSLQRYEQSLKKCEKLSLSSVYSGHGEVINKPKQLIPKRIQSILRKAERIKRLIGDRRLTPAQIAFEFYRERYETLFALVMSEIIGHLNRLESLREVDYMYIRNERYYYVK